MPRVMVRASLLNRTCVQHLDRPAIAACMTCKANVCQECATRFNGINYCVRCLNHQAADHNGVRSRWTTLGLPVAVALLIPCCIAACTWALLLWARISA